MSNLNNLETHQIVFPWEINKEGFNKFTEINCSFTSHFISNTCIEVPEATSIDLHPLLPPLLDIENRPWLHQLLNHNDNLRIEILEKDIINIKSMADIQLRQNTEVLGQLSNWTHQNGLVTPNSSKSLFTLTLPNNRVAIYGPSCAYFPLNQHLAIPKRVREDNFIPIAPSFVIENISYAHGQNNSRIYLQSKMVDWIEGGVESGLMIDGKDRKIDLFCRTSTLMPQQGKHKIYIHPQVADQLRSTGVNPAPPVYPPNYHLLSSEQRRVLNIQHIEYYEYFETSNFHHICFLNLTLVPGHPDVSTVSIPFWDGGDPQVQPQLGPNTIVHCIGEVNSFKLNLSRYPLE